MLGYIGDDGVIAHWWLFGDLHKVPESIKLVSMEGLEDAVKNFASVISGPLV